MPPQGETALSLHLVAPGVPRPNQKVGEPLRLTDLAHMELAAAGGEDRGGHGPLEQALHGGHQHRTVPRWSRARISRRWCSHWREAAPG